MNVIDCRPLALPGVFVVRYKRFRDGRGYFTEHFRKSDVAALCGGAVMGGGAVVQANESYSSAGTVRGLHFQWQPYQGKLVRTLRGRMVDLVLDIRPGSPTLGRVVAHDMPADPERDWDEWIWVPPGFAHGNYYTEASSIEYLCTGEYNPSAEAGISLCAGDLDWSLCDPLLKREFDSVLASPGAKMSEKDRDAFSMVEWLRDSRSAMFLPDRFS